VRDATRRGHPRIPLTRRAAVLPLPRPSSPGFCLFLHFFYRPPGIFTPLAHFNPFSTPRWAMVIAVCVSHEDDEKVSLHTPLSPSLARVNLLKTNLFYAKTRLARCMRERSSLCGGRRGQPDVRAPVGVASGRAGGRVCRRSEIVQKSSQENGLAIKHCLFLQSLPIKLFAHLSPPPLVCAFWGASNQRREERGEVQVKQKRCEGRRRNSSLALAAGKCGWTTALYTSHAIPVSRESKIFRPLHLLLRAVSHAPQLKTASFVRSFARPPARSAAPARALRKTRAAMNARGGRAGYA